MFNKLIYFLLISTAIISFSTGLFLNPQKRLDGFLKKNICCVWVSGENEITFYKNSTFSEDIYFTGKNNRKSLLVTIKGKYFIDEGILYKKTCEWNFKEINTIQSENENFEKYNLKIADNIMKLNENIELRKKDNSKVSTDDTSSGKHWGIKDFNSAGADITCVKKEYFFVLEKKFDIPCSDIAQFLPSDRNKKTDLE